MAKTPIIKYRVIDTEFERGWGQRPYPTYFDTRKDAQAYIDQAKKVEVKEFHRNKGVAPECYWRVSDTITVVELNEDGKEVR